MSDYREVWWRESVAESYRCGWLVEWSAHGIGLLVEKPDAPKIGATISPKRRPDLRSWTREAVVRRVQPLSGLLTLVGAEYVAPERRPAVLRPSRSLKADRRGVQRPTPDRRRSLRWVTQTPVRWRTHRGRRLREAMVIERSLEGIVLRSRGHDRIPVGKRIYAVGDEKTEPQIFRSAIVRRVEHPSPDETLLFAEIEHAAC